MFDELAERARPMIDAGWRLVSTARDESWEFGDSVFYDLERDGRLIELEYYEHGQLVAYEVDDAQDADEESTIFVIPDSSAMSSLEAFRAHEWV